jgi:hypothetical protein
MVKIQVKFSWVVTPHSVVAGYHEDGESKILQNIGILLQHYTAS